MKASLLSHTKVEDTLVAAVSPVLHTRAPTGKLFGPALTSLESSLTTFQVSGVIVRTGAAEAGWTESKTAPSKAALTPATRDRLGGFKRERVGSVEARPVQW